MSSRIFFFAVSVLTLSTLSWGDDSRSPASLKFFDSQAKEKHLHDVFRTVISDTRKLLEPTGANEAELILTKNVAKGSQTTQTPAISPARAIASAPQSTTRSAIPWATGAGATFRIK